MSRIGSSSSLSSGSSSSSGSGSGSSSSSSLRARVRVSEHAIDQYKRRIVLNDSTDKKTLTEQIKYLFSQSYYAGDNDNGILFRNEDLMIEFIVRNRCIVTLFPITKRGY